MALSLSSKILTHVMQFRRIAGRKKSCATSGCPTCLAPHLKQVMTAVEKNQPIIFVLPAFPAKSPNLSKVLGVLPDMAEKLALEFLNNLCKQIQAIYAPGARIVLCSDGRVFNDVIGMTDTEVGQYQDEISRLTKEMPLDYLSTFNLDDAYPALDFNQMRDHLMEQYGEPLVSLQEAVRRGSKAGRNCDDEEIHRQYCGITRFLVEDGTHPKQTMSRTALQKACRQRAYIVIQRSRAWSALIETYFPNAVRLSIHPQTCGSYKLGICLMEAENWMTPWHGVAVNVGNRFILLKRSQAEEMGARLMYRQQRPSHYEL